MAYKVVRSPRKRARPMKGRLARKVAKYGVKEGERKKKREARRAARKNRPAGVAGSKEYGNLSYKDQIRVSAAEKYNAFNARNRAASTTAKSRKR